MSKDFNEEYVDNSNNKINNNNNDNQIEFYPILSKDKASEDVRHHSQNANPSQAVPLSLEGIK